jgi:CubicO group peptidase (beta-lactamase class C family)
MKEIQNLIHQATEQSMASGIAVAVIERDQPITMLYAGYGLTAAHPIDARSIFDLASLTKVMVTTWLVGLCMDRKNLNLDQPMSEVLADPPPNVAQCTWRQLLSHQSGFPAWADFSKVPYDGLLSAIGQISPLHAPNQVTVYSDINFLLLGLALEKFCKQSLKMQLSDACNQYAVALAYASDIPSNSPFVPTGNSALRKNICGTVYDDNAFYLNRATGHAGLMGTLEAACQWWKAYRHSLSHEVHKKIFEAHTAKDGSVHALGWDVPTGDSSAGSLVGQHARGHLGYTGTSIWYDPEIEVMVITLTNRTFCNTEAGRMRAFRQNLHNEVWRQYGKS